MRDLQSQMPGRKPMLFVHIPKTAGTSIRNGAAAFHGRNLIALDYGPGNRATSPIVNRLIHGAEDPASFRAAFDRKGLKFIGGHIRLADYIGVFDLDNVATFVREPVQRVISSYTHFVCHYGYKKDIETFVADPKFQNRQSKALAGIPVEQIGFVGIMEEFDESLHRLNEHFHWEAPRRKANLGKRPTGRPDKSDLSLRRRILECNRLDHELYCRARTIFENRSMRSTAESVTSLGACNLHDRKILRGWACRIASEQAVEVRVEVNGHEAARLRADLFRPDIRDRGFKRSGCAGFELKLTELSSGDIVRCLESDYGTELKNSPLHVS